jgi:hypothetical protein
MKVRELVENNVIEFNAKLLNLYKRNPETKSLDSKLGISKSVSYVSNGIINIVKSYVVHKEKPKKVKRFPKPKIVSKIAFKKVTEETLYDLITNILNEIVSGTSTDQTSIALIIAASITDSPKDFEFSIVDEVIRKGLIRGLKIRKEELKVKKSKNSSDEFLNILNNEIDSLFSDSNKMALLIIDGDSVAKTYDKIVKKLFDSVKANYSYKSKETVGTGEEKTLKQVKYGIHEIAIIEALFKKAPRRGKVTPVVTKEELEKEVTSRGIKVDKTYPYIIAHPNGSQKFPDYQFYYGTKETSDSEYIRNLVGRKSSSVYIEAKSYTRIKGTEVTYKSFLRRLESSNNANIKIYFDEINNPKNNGKALYFALTKVDFHAILNLFDIHTSPIIYIDLAGKTKKTYIKVLDIMSPKFYDVFLKKSADGKITIENNLTKKTVVDKGIEQGKTIPSAFAFEIR